MATAKIEVGISSDCICTDYDDETGEAVASEWCHGYCFNDSVDVFEELVVSPLILAHPELHRFKVEGSGMGWQRRSGTAEIMPYARDIVSQLTINGDFRLNVSYEFGDTFTVVRYSHDEPTGASFVYTILKEDEQVED
jgi:hypothetical protein